MAKCHGGAGEGKGGQGRASKGVDLASDLRRFGTGKPSERARSVLATFAKLANYHSLSYWRLSKRCPMRVFKVKAFVRFQRRERIANNALCKAIAAADSGIVDAELGGGLIKQRVARLGQGKSGGFRTIIAYRSAGRAVFLFGFAKSERSNIDADELKLLVIAHPSASV